MFKYILIAFMLVSAPLANTDTLIRSGCSKDYLGVKWFIYQDADGNRYSTKDVRSWECGFNRYLNLSMEKDAGDRFDPAIVNVDYKDMLGRNEPWGMVHHSTTIGEAVRVGRDTVHIFGDGRTGDGIFTLGRQEIQFRIEEEPLCKVDSGVDCEGYTQRSNQQFIYYGEDDNRIVTWELGVLVYASHRDYGEDVPKEILEEWDENHPQWAKWENRVAEYNRVYALSGVHVQYKLSKLYLAHWHNLYDIGRMTTGKPFDVALGYGTSYPDTCGVARVKTYFSEGKPPYSMSRCNTYTDLHEIGHSVGLAHGPENQAYRATGYIFPEFGHGWNDICNGKDDLMSYGNEGVFHSNSKLYCDEIFRDWYPTILAGGREWSDTAHALNRVRYNVSLIHDENKYVDPDSRLQPMMSTSRRIEIEIID
tara:strand:- start:90 stop:1352 length:1263 start_codon:yes stop_codon:yes gene_type:complete